MQTRYIVSHVLGGLMIGIGLWILASTLVMQRPPITTSRGLDIGFAGFFILRGAMNVHRARMAARRRITAPNAERDQG